MLKETHQKLFTILESSHFRRGRERERERESCLDDLLPSDENDDCGDDGRQKHEPSEHSQGDDSS